jgi:hypothetical protein
MIRPTCKITIGNFEFDYLTEIELVSAWKNLTDTGTIKIPRKIKRGGQTLVAGSKNLFKRGDRVEVMLGYYPESFRAFTGFVSAILPESPLVLQIEDDAYLFKQNAVTVSYKEVTLKKLLTDLCPIKFVSVDANLGAFRISNANFAQVLAELKTTYGLVSWVRASVLYCGRAYFPETSTKHKLVFQRDIIDNSLEYMREDDVKIKVKAISIAGDNTKIEVEVGDPQGAQRTLTYYGLNESDLRATAERELPKLIYEGYRGDFTTFGKPIIEHGDTVELIDLKFTERNGEYLVDEVVKTQGSGGYRQKVKLGAKVSI